MTDIIVGIDPGDKHTGIVSLDAKTGALRGFQTITYDETVAGVEAFNRIHMQNDDRLFACMEVFQLYPGRQGQAQAWSSFPIVELIGIIKYLCKSYGIPLQMGRPPDINRFMKHRSLPGQIPKSGLGKHQVSAYRLAEYYRIMYYPEVAASLPEPSGI